MAGDANPRLSRRNRDDHKVGGWTDEHPKQNVDDTVHTNVEYGDQTSA